MNYTHDLSPRPARPSMCAVLLALLTASACATGAVGRQTEIMQSSGAVSATAVALRAQVNDLADRLAGHIEETADHIRVEAVDRGVRDRALAFKADAVPAVYAAAYRADPLTAAADLWGLTVQIAHWVEEGAGRDAFGPQQPLARAGAGTLTARAGDVMRRLAASPEAFDRARSRLEDWARRHPIEYTVSSRASAATFMSELRTEDRDVFVAVGAVSDTIENVSERLNTYVAQLPRQARWQAELLLSEATGDQDVEGALAAVGAVGDAARRADRFLESVPALLDTVGATAGERVMAERRAVMDWVEAERLLTLEFAVAERRVVLEALAENRIAAVDAIGAELSRALQVLDKERVAVLDGADGITNRAVGSAMTALGDLVDRTLVKVAVLLLALMFVATALAVMAYRLTLGRRPAAHAA